MYYILLLAIQHFTEKTDTCDLFVQTFENHKVDSVGKITG